MRLPRNLVFIVVAGLVVALLATVGFFLFRGISQLADITRQLSESKQELVRYYRKDPFPSRANITKEQENVKVVEKWFRGLRKKLSEGTVPQQKDWSPSKFMDLLGEKRKSLGDLARKNGTSLRDNFGFGFEHYFATGSPPAPGDVPRLTQQLVIVEKLCMVFFGSGTKGINAIERDEFEGSVTGRSARSGGRSRSSRSAVARAGIMGEDDLYTTLHFKFEIEVRQDGFLLVLNRLARLSMFVVVTSVEMEKQGTDVLMRGKPLQEGEETPSSIERMVSGSAMEKPMKVRIEMDVYTFRGE